MLAVRYEVGARTRFEPESGILWARMKHRERACYTPDIMRDMRDFQLHLRDLYAGSSLDECPIRWLVWASDAPKAWSLGGDLASFTRMIRAGDEAGLRAYAHLAIDILHDNLIGMDLPILTVAMVTGDAIGGGFEAMLTDDVVIAERGAKFGLPEILFNLFPGMGAYSFLERKVGQKAAEGKQGRLRPNCGLGPAIWLGDVAAAGTFAGDAPIGFGQAGGKLSHDALAVAGRCSEMVPHGSPLLVLRRLNWCAATPTEKRAARRVSYPDVFARDAILGPPSAASPMRSRSAPTSSTVRAESSRGRVPAPPSR